MLMKRLQNGPPLLLDGATGTELHRRGINLSHPSWTAGVILDDPTVLREIHRDYVQTGADILTANTFRTHHRNVATLGRKVSARDLTCRAVEIAREAAGQTHVMIAGSVAPLADCYSPHLTPGVSELVNEHGMMVENLVTAGVDLILIETQVTIQEAVIAARAAGRSGLPFFISFACLRNGSLLSGESLLDAWSAVAPLAPEAVLVNCLPAEEVLPTLRPLLEQEVPYPLGAYANTGRLMPDRVWESTSGVLPAVYAGFAERWKESGLRVIGGCCGTTPDHISAIHTMLYAS